MQSLAAGICPLSTSQTCIEAIFIHVPNVRTFLELPGLDPTFSGDGCVGGLINIGSIMATRSRGEGYACLDSLVQVATHWYK
jgi:hypothetical protein